MDKSTANIVCPIEQINNKWSGAYRRRRSIMMVYSCRGLHSFAVWACIFDATVHMIYVKKCWLYYQSYTSSLVGIIRIHSSTYSPPLLWSIIWRVCAHILAVCGRMCCNGIINENWWQSGKDNTCISCEALLDGLWRGICNKYFCVRMMDLFYSIYLLFVREISDYFEIVDFCVVLQYNMPIAY